MMCESGPRKKPGAILPNGGKAPVTSRPVHSDISSFAPRAPKLLVSTSLIITILHDQRFVNGGVPQGTQDG